MASSKILRTRKGRLAVTISLVRSMIVLGFAFALVEIATAQSVAPQAPAERKPQVTLTYMGTAAWEISDRKTVILIDPYLSRIQIRAPSAPTSSGQAADPRPAHEWNEVVEPDAVTIDAHIHQANFILVTHTHIDHVMDVPHIALKTHATVIGTESTENVMRAFSVPEDQLITVRGGEDYDFGDFSVKVIPSLHSPLDHKRYFSPEKAPSGMKAPLTLRQMDPEGGTLAYLVRFHEHQILAFGANNYIERELDKLSPDVVLVGAGPSRREIYDYTGRLMRALDFPALVLPTHWDNYTEPYGASQQPAFDALQSFIQEVKAASPKTNVIVPKYFEPIPLDDAP
jgi:L-ascorbate metabolism protein UlaG (beta-lactamase superfamily)